MSLARTRLYLAGRRCIRGKPTHSYHSNTYGLLQSCCGFFDHCERKSLNILPLFVYSSHEVVELPGPLLRNRFPDVELRAVSSVCLIPRSTFGTLALCNASHAVNVPENTTLSDIVDAVCLVLDDHEWCADTEVKLETLLHKITPDLVLRVVRLLKEPALALEFLHWASTREGYQPTVEAFTHIIARFGRKRNFTVAWRLLDEMRRNQLEVDYAFSIFIQRLKRAKKAQGLVKAMCGMKFLKVTPTISLYTSVIEFLLKNSFGEDAEYLYNQMLQDGLVPDKMLFQILVKGFSKLGRFDETLLFLETMKKLGYVPHVSVYTTAICEMAIGGKLEAGHQTHLEMIRNGCLPKVFGTWEVACALHGNDTLKQLEEFEQVIWKMPSKLRVYSFNNLLQFLLGAGKYEEVKQVFHRLEFVDQDSANVAEGTNGKVSIWNMDSYKIYIVGMCKLGHVDHALETFSDLLRRGRKLTNDISSFLLFSLSGANMADEAIDLCKHIIKYRESISIDAQKSFLTMLRTSRHLNVACKVFLSLRKNGCIHANSDFEALVGYNNDI